MNRHRLSGHTTLQRRRVLIKEVTNKLPTGGRRSTTSIIRSQGSGVRQRKVAEYKQKTVDFGPAAAWSVFVMTVRSIRGSIDCYGTLKQAENYKTKSVCTECNTDRWDLYFCTSAAR